MGSENRRSMRGDLLVAGLMLDGSVRANVRYKGLQDSIEGLSYVLQSVSRVIKHIVLDKKVSLMYGVVLAALPLLSRAMSSRTELLVESYITTTSVAQVQ